MHLWAHLWWDEWRTDFTIAHGGMIGKDYVRYAETTYAITARRFLAEAGGRAAPVIPDTCGVDARTRYSIKRGCEFFKHLPQ